MSVSADLIYRTKAQVRADLISAWQARFPNAWVEEDGIAWLLFDVLAGSFEGVYLANQLLRDNIFIQTANLVELRRHGDQFGLPIKAGTPAVGNVVFSGIGGTLVPAGTEISAITAVLDSLYFQTTADATIPDPGVPSAPAVADGGAGAMSAGLYQYKVTFVTAAGETIPGTQSADISIAASHQINLSSISLGGPGTTQRRIYRQRDGGGFFLRATLTNNTATTYTDNTAADGVTLPPVTSSAQAISVGAQSVVSGSIYNVVPGAINALVAPPSGISSVTNPLSFSGGTDEEDMEDFRLRLLDYIRNPKTGSPADLESWALEIEGVAAATAFPNDNLGTPTNGHVTVRLVGPGGTIPDSDVIAAVLALLNSKDLANITIHVTTFTSVSTNVSVTLTLATGYTLAQVTPQVQTAISDYVNEVAVGGTVYITGIIDAVLAVPGILDLTVTVPATNQTSTATQKRVAGTISVS